MLPAEIRPPAQAQTLRSSETQQEQRAIVDESDAPGIGFRVSASVQRVDVAQPDGISERACRRVDAAADRDNGRSILRHTGSDFLLEGHAFLRICRHKDPWCVAGGISAPGSFVAYVSLRQENIHVLAEVADRAVLV